MELYSCDTFVALGNSTKSGKVIFAKNSDRPINEQQNLVIYPARDYDKGQNVKCTYIEIPQLEHTYRVIGSKPYWIWGFEHGMNEKGVVIGNEAVWSREPEEKENGLLGMDLLRLGLERGATAYEALHIITGLLETYGQGGNAAVNIEHRYHNSFLIVDTKEAWVLDTCGRRWVARKVKDVLGISNCYSTETEWDEDSGDIVEYAISKGWTNKHTEFNFAKAYGAMNLKHRAAYPRYARLNKLLKAQIGRIDEEYIKKIQRDHFEGESFQPRWSPADGLLVSICMHSMTEDSSRTAASSYVELDNKGNSTWWHSFGNPCISAYLPYSINNNLPPSFSEESSKFINTNIWWLIQRLQYSIEFNYQKFAPICKDTFLRFENEVKAEAAKEENISDENVEKFVNKLIWIVNDLYSGIISSDIDFIEPQHYKLLQKVLKDAGIGVKEDMYD